MASRRLAIVVAGTLLVGITASLILAGTRGAEIANVLALPIAVLGLWAAATGIGKGQSAGKPPPASPVRPPLPTKDLPQRST